jgi:hypothetical protein
MLREEAYQITPADRIYWHDPDNETCSRFLNIKSIEFDWNIATIEEIDGSVIECYVDELEKF